MKLAASEQQIHLAVAQWIVLHEPKYPELKFMFHCPNGSWKTPAQRGIFRAMLQRKGVPDFMLNWDNGAFKGLAIELKSEVGKLTAEQADWLGYLRGQGWFCEVCRTVDEAVFAITQYCGRRAVKP